MARWKAEGRGFSAVPYFVSGSLISKSYHPTIIRLSYSNLSLGLSAGADFAVQMQVAYSQHIMGLGVFAGEPYVFVFVFLCWKKHVFVHKL